MKERPILIHEVRDMWPETLVVGYGMKRYNPFVWLLQRAENSAYRKSDYVVSTLEYAKEHMLKHGLKKKKYRYLTNGVTLQDWENPLELPKMHKDALQKIKEQGKFLIGYFGGMTPLDTLDFYLDAIKKVNCDSIQFVLVGDGRERERLEQRIRSEKIRNCFILPRIEKKAIPNLLKWFDCIYMGTEYTELNKYGISLTKMTDAMISGVPIIFRTNIDNLVSQNNAGIIVDTKNPQKLADKFIEIYEMDADERRKMGLNGHNAVVNNYTYEKIAENYTKLFPAKENLHILMIQHYAGSNSMGMVFRPYYLAREWVKRGYKVDIIAASYSHLRVKNPEIEKSFKKQEIDGIVYHWVKTRTYEGNGIKRAFSIFDFVGQTLVHASEIAKTLQPDVIIAGSTYMLDTYIGQKIRRKTK